MKEPLFVRVCFFFIFFRFDKIEKSQKGQIVWLFISWISYFFVRYILSHFYGLETGTSSLGFDPILANYQFGPLPIIRTFEGFLIFALIAVYFVYRKSTFGAILFSGGVVLISVVAFMVYDLGRSLSYLFIVIVLSLIIVNDHIGKKDFQYFSLYTCILCFFIPTVRFFGIALDWMGPIIPKVFGLL